MTRLFAVFFILLVLIAGSLFIVSYYFGEDIKQKLINELNKELEAEISVGQIHLNLYEKFPHASLIFSNVNSNEKNLTPGKSLVKAEKISLLFNVYDILSGHYKINRIHLEGGFLNLLKRKDGTVNYKLFNKSDKNIGGNVKIAIEKIALKNVSIFYYDQTNDHEYFFRVNNGAVRLSGAGESRTVNAWGDIYSNHIKAGTQIYFENREFQINVLFNTHNFPNLIDNIKGQIISQGLTFNISGNVDFKNDLLMDVVMVAQPAPVSTFTSLIPSDYIKPYSDYKLTGILNFEARIKGKLTRKNIPHVLVRFNLQKGRFQYEKKQISLNDLYFTGNFENGDLKTESSYSLVLDAIQATHKAGKIEGALSIIDFTRPDIKVAFNAIVDLNELKNEVRFEKIKEVSGKLAIQMQFSKKLYDYRRFTTLDFVNSQTSGTLELTDVDFELENNSHNFKNFNGLFEFNNKDLAINNFSGFVSKNDFQMEGYFRNLLAYLFLPGEKGIINAGFYSKSLDLNDLVAGNTINDKETINLRFSDRLNFDLDVTIDSFSFRKFSATKFKGHILLQDKLFTVKQAHFRSMGGQIDLKGSINGRYAGNYKLLADASFKDVNIRDLFYDFGDFNQHNLTYQHLKGRVNAKVEYLSDLGPQLSITPQSVLCFADIEINEGELINYKPLGKLSRYIHEEELKHIRFSRLKNKIKIADKVIHFPEMDITSNSLDIGLYGTHSFQNEIDYHIQLLVSDLISKKEKIKQDLGDNFEKDDKVGKTKLFLNMTGNADNPDIKYDTREVRNKIAGDLEKEKQNLKTVLAEEFKWITGDKNKNSTDSLYFEGESNKDFVIEWERNDSILPKKDTLKETKKKTYQSGEKDFIIIWDEVSDTIK